MALDLLEMEIRNMIKKNYKLMDNVPREIEWDKYCQKVEEEYCKILEASNSEDVLQKFFEENPSLIPGALELIGQSGHCPYMGALITQPEIGCNIKRKPDFMWMAQDGLTFCPVFIEIEKPSKQMFTKNKTPSAEFTQAINQIDEWKVIFNKPENILNFYEKYNIPLSMRKKIFEPQYLLVYGRREEYIDDEHLTRLRKKKENENVVIMSFDRLRPISDYKQFVTCKLVDGKYHVVNISPTFRYRHVCAKDLYNWIGFNDAIDSMKYTSDERKKFLKERYDYWYSFKGEVGGIISTMNAE